MQLCPELLYPVRAQTRAAAGMSASSQTIVAAFPPSSSTRRLRPAARATAVPVAALPVKLIDGDLVGRAQRGPDVAAAVQQLHRLGGHARRRAAAPRSPRSWPGPAAAP